ncbi:MAG: hypothetical protein ACREBD_11400 [Blastocatellia bacterium]
MIQTSIVEERDLFNLPYPSRVPLQIDVKAFDSAIAEWAMSLIVFAALDFGIKLSQKWNPPSRN